MIERQPLDPVSFGAIAFRTLCVLTRAGSELDVRERTEVVTDRAEILLLVPVQCLEGDRFEWRQNPSYVHGRILESCRGTVNQFDIWSR